MPSPSIAIATAAQSDRAFLGHPRGLAYLAFAEAFERFSYYGMQTLLVLYMVRQLLLPGHVERIVGFSGFRAALERVYGGPLSTVALASAIFGLYTGLVYLTPIGGGLIADRWLGRTRTVILGSLLMALGHFLMAFDVSFLIALTCLLIGVGCFKGNLASQIGALYAPGDLRRADAFQIYYLAIQAGVIATPLIAGTLGEVYGWHYGFGAAGVGMLFSLVIYLSGRRWLPVELVERREKVARLPLSPRERLTVVVLIVLLPIMAIGIIGNQEIFNAYLLWVPSHINMVFFGRTMPTTWLITVDSIVSISFLVIALAFWRLWAKHFKEPNEINKMIIGFVLAMLAIAALAIASTFATPEHKASFGWVLAFEVLNSAGFANIMPVGLALYARASPKAIASTIMGVYFLHLFAANNLVGWLGGLQEKLTGAQFWGLHAGLIGASVVLTLVISRLFGHLLAPGEAGANAAH